MKIPLLKSFGVVLLLLTPAGCNHAASHILGVQPASVISATANDLKAVPTSQTVVLRGEMIEKCPVAGCWFMLKDKTGVVRVDTKSAGFVVSDVPLHTTMTVSGQIVPGNEPQISATGVSY